MTDPNPPPPINDYVILEWPLNYESTVKGLCAPVTKSKYFTPPYNQLSLTDHFITIPYDSKALTDIVFLFLMFNLWIWQNRTNKKEQKFKFLVWCISSFTKCFQFITPRRLFYFWLPADERQHVKFPVRKTSIFYWYFNFLIGYIYFVLIKCCYNC